MAVDVDTGNDTAGDGYLLPTAGEADARHILVEAGQDGAERQSAGREGGSIGGAGFAVLGGGGRGVLIGCGILVIRRPISISRTLYGLLAKEGSLVVDAQYGQIEGNGDPLHRAAEHDGRQRLASPDVCAVPHDVGVGDDAVARHEEAGARRRGLGPGPPGFGVVGLHALNDELYLHACVVVVGREIESLALVRT